MTASDQVQSPVATIRAQLHTNLLTRGRVVFIGLGGIGHILARHAVQFLSSLDGEQFRVVLCDGDDFSSDNSYRVDVPDFDNKASAVATDLESRFGRSGLQIRMIPEYVTASNAQSVIQPGDFVLLAVDNHETRRLVSARCAELDDVVLISGGNDGVEAGRTGTYGNLQVFIRSGGCDLTASLDRFHPEIAHPADVNPAELDCIEMAAAGAPQLSFMNLAIASAMCNTLLRLLMLPSSRMYDEVAVDILKAVSVPQWLTGGGDSA